jgi:fumarate reductase subunit C
MEGWWNRVPFFQRYMAREVTAFFVAVYGLVMLAGLVRLAQGEAAFNGWLEQLRSGWSIALHVVLLLVFIYHTYSWFEIMPKTMPMIFVGGKRVEGSAITRTGWIATVAVSVVMLALTWWWKK